ncbi:MAG: aldose 1-epimerase family protein [Candidatus Latescibacteria bacterium]|jgi:hypothetical protein|nr:aldose 1-epimerase family protein [Candidatus Latescibacterota bacterium]
MAELFGTSLNKTEILERVGDIAQLCDARKMTCTEGRSTGVQSIEVKTGSGLSFTVLPSRGLDISRASYNGIPLAWQSAIGETSPFSYQPENYEWLRSFFGGLLTTCGMTYSAHPCEDNDEQLGLHGRVSNIPAEDVNVNKTWDGDEYLITICGRVRETKVFGDNLILERKIETSLGSRKIQISDSIENVGFRESPLMMLYHINIGWPVVSHLSRLVAPVLHTKFLDGNARREPDQWDKLISPQKDYAERVYLHELAPASDGMVNLALVNEEKNIGVRLSYLKNEFPYFIEWKMMGQGEYVVGIEPGNITGHRAHMRKEGTLEFIKPGEKRNFTLEIGVIDEKKSIKKVVGQIKSVKLS